MDKAEKIVTKFKLQANKKWKKPVTSIELSVLYEFMVWLLEHYEISEKGK